MTQLNIRYDEGEQKYYVYFTDAWNNCVFESEGFDTLIEAESFKQDQEDSVE